MTDTNASCTLQLTAEERDELLALLHRAMDEARVEEHHTDNREFRKGVKHEEDLLRSMLAKLQAAA